MQVDQALLLQPISADRPCGEDLEDTQLLASFDAYHVFGQATPLTDEIDWREIRDRSLEALRTSKDLRVLTHLASAAVRTDGLAPFTAVVGAGSKWLQTWWADVYPRVDDDAILRRNALNGLADRMAVLDGLRRAPVVSHKQLGSFAIRDIEIITGVTAPAKGETKPDPAQLNAVLAATELEELKVTAAQLDALLQGYKAIEEAMGKAGGAEATPEFGAVTTPVTRTLKLINDHIATRAGSQQANGEKAVADAGGGAPAAVISAASIRTRDDAIRALDAVALFFRNNEPSSPVPMFIERAKRLIAKDFLAVLADVVPSALPQAKQAGGVTEPSK